MYLNILELVEKAKLSNEQTEQLTVAAQAQLINLVHLTMDSILELVKVTHKC